MKFLKELIYIVICVVRRFKMRLNYFIGNGWLKYKVK